MMYVIYDSTRNEFVSAYHPNAEDCRDRADFEGVLSVIDGTLVDALIFESLEDAKRAFERIFDDPDNKDPYWKITEDKCAIYFVKREVVEAIDYKYLRSSMVPANKHITDEINRVQMQFSLWWTMKESKIKIGEIRKWNYTSDLNQYFVVMDITCHDECKIKYLEDGYTLYHNIHVILSHTISVTNEQKDWNWADQKVAFKK